MPTWRQVTDDKGDKVTVNLDGIAYAWQPRGKYGRFHFIGAGRRLEDTTLTFLDPLGVSFIDDLVALARGLDNNFRVLTGTDGATILANLQHVAFLKAEPEGKSRIYFTGPGRGRWCAPLAISISEPVTAITVEPVEAGDSLRG